MEKIEIISLSINRKKRWIDLHSKDGSQLTIEVYINSSRVYGVYGGSLAHVQVIAYINLSVHRSRHLTQARATTYNIGAVCRSDTFDLTASES